MHLAANRDSQPLPEQYDALDSSIVRVRSLARARVFTLDAISQTEHLTRPLIAICPDGPT